MIESREKKLRAEIRDLAGGMAVSSQQGEAEPFPKRHPLALGSGVVLTVGGI